LAAKKAKPKATKSKKSKKTKKLTSDKGMAFVTSSYNNTIVSITDLAGNVVADSSPGKIGFKGSRKSTAYASTKAGEDVAERAQQAGIREIAIYVKGLGLGRNSAIKGMKAAGIKITSITDKTPIPHGGPTPRKAPRGS
jgi:small subunit ribosomal protein S11